MGVIKNPRKIFIRSLCVTSRFVALLDEKAGNPSFQPPGEQMHKFTLCSHSSGSRPKGILTDVQFKEKHMAICGKSKIRGLVMAPALFALVAGISPMAQAQDEQSGLSAPMEGAPLADSQRGLASPIEGSWVFAIDVIGQGTVGNSGNSLISFAAGGVVVTTGSLPPAPPFHGNWKQREPNRFNAAFYGFISDAAGRGVALSKISLQLHLTSRNELAGTAVAYTCDLQAENCISSVDFQFTGKRLASE
jgi:hypothetical protein